MNVDRETVFQALFDLVSQAPGFVTRSRRWVPWSNCPASLQPALYQAQSNQRADEQAATGLTRWTLHAWLMIYNRIGADPAAIPSTPLNQLVDAVENVLQAPCGEKQTLGGLVTQCSIVGDVLIDEGVLDQQGIAMLPIVIITGE
jgi:hypothetical protein